MRGRCYVMPDTDVTAPRKRPPYRRQTIRRLCPPDGVRCLADVTLSDDSLARCQLRSDADGFFCHVHAEKWFICDGCDTAKREPAAYSRINEDGGFAYCDACDAAMIAAEPVFPDGNLD